MAEHKMDFQPTPLSFLRNFTDTSAFLEGIKRLPRLENAAQEYRTLLRPAEGMGYCIDERPVKDGTQTLKPAFAGGAAGWAAMFQMQGASLEQAVEATQQLYTAMEWGDKEVHTDDHGHPIGCGFAKELPHVASTLVSLSDNTPLVRLNAQTAGQLNGGTIISKLQESGARLVTLTGDHKPNEAYVVINSVQGTTLDRSALYHDKPAFVWDAHATTSAGVFNAFNSSLRACGIDPVASRDHFVQTQIAMHMVTGVLLGAIHLDNPNIVQIRA